MKKFKIMLLSMIIFSVSSCNNNSQSNSENIIDNSNKTDDESINESNNDLVSLPEENINSNIQLISPLKNESIGLVDDDVYDYMNGINKIDKYKGNKKDFQKNIKLSWTSKNDVNQDYEISISTNIDFKDKMTFHTNNKEILITNLLVNTYYFWKVNDSSIRMFKTKDLTPRYINVEGVNNLRDLGGIKDENGNSICQGLIYRGSEMNNNFNITQNGIDTMINDLKIKTDIDLRTVKETNNISSSPLGDIVKYVNIPSFEGYTKVTVNKQKENYKKVFEILADKNSYPVYFHCYLGADRTGTLAGIIEGLMGINEENRNKDYELTTFSSNDETSYRNANEKFIFVTKNISMLYAADTYQQSVEKYLEEFVGISKEQIESIKNILSGKETIINPTICKLVNQ